MASKSLDEIKNELIASSKDREEYVERLIQLYIDAMDSNDIPRARELCVAVEDVASRLDFSHDINASIAFNRRLYALHTRLEQIDHQPECYADCDDPMCPYIH